MTLEQAIFLTISGIAIVLFITEWVRIDIVAILVILALTVTKLIDENAAFSGFSSEPAIIVAAVFVLSAGLSSTGVTDLIGQAVGRLAGASETRANIVVMTAVAALSAFTHHLMITAMMLPIVMKICKEKNIHASRMLIPMATAASLGTTLTLIGAPAFLLANQILMRGGQPNLGLFGPTRLGFPLVGASFALIVLLKWALPRISGKHGDDESRFQVPGVVTELTLPAESKWIGKTYAEFKAENLKRFEIRTWLRARKNGGENETPGENEFLEEADIFVVNITSDELMSIDEPLGIAIRSVKRFGNLISEGVTSLSHEGNQVLKTVIAPRAPLIGKTLGEVRFFQTYGVVAIGMWRKTGWICDKISETVLREGDLIVLWGPPENLEKLTRNRSFLLFMPFKGRPKRRIKIPLAAGIMVASVSAAALGWLPAYVAFVAGAIAMILFNCVSIGDAYDSIETKIYVMISGMIPLGIAMEKTGTDELLANFALHWTEGWTPFYVLLVFFWLAGLLTQVLSDAATVVLLAPIALAFAKGADISPTAAVVTVTIGAIASFLTPIGHHGNLLILSPGGYRFADFFKIGLPLTMLISVMTSYLTLLYF